MLDRQDLVKRLMWIDGGTGFGICRVAAMDIWACDEPREGHPDLVSIVAIHGPERIYTDWELQKLVEFSEKATSAYDTRWKHRRGANLIIIGKDPEYTDLPWLKKRMSWIQGPMRSQTLTEALAVFNRDIHFSGGGQ